MRPNLKANILVKDRSTGQLIEERMPVYIRLGIRLLYQKAGSGIKNMSYDSTLLNIAADSSAVKKLLRNMSKSL